MKDTLKALREQNNYSQVTVSKYLDISRQMYIKYENGEAEPPVKVIKSLSKLYKVTYDVIIDDTLRDSPLKKKQALYDDTDPSVLIFDEAAPAYGTSKSSVSANLDLAKTLIPKLNIFEQLDLLSLLANAIGKKGINGIVNSELSKPGFGQTAKKQLHLKTLSKSEKDELFAKYTGFLKGADIGDSKQARLEHIQSKYGI